MAAPPASPGTSPRRGSFAFLARFAGFLVLFYLLVALRPVNDHVIVPFTAGIARASGTLLRTLGEPVSVEGTEIRSSSFAVQIENGCNGLETILLFVSAVLAFPAAARWRAAGLLVGFAAIEAFNLLRVASLVWVGGHRPALFSSFHTILWQSLVVLFGVLLFLFWAARAGSRARRAEAVR